MANREEVFSQKILIIAVDNLTTQTSQSKLVYTDLTK